MSGNVPEPVPEPSKENPPGSSTNPLQKSTEMGIIGQMSVTKSSDVNGEGMSELSAEVTTMPILTTILYHWGYFLLHSFSSLSTIGHYPEGSRRRTAGQ